MKIGGKKLEGGPNVMTCFLPREGREPIVFKCQAVLEVEEFDKNYPAPEPPTIVHKTRGKSKDVEDKTYVALMSKHNEQRWSWIVLKSLSATEGLEWDTVNMSDPETWGNYEQDLKSAGLSTHERNLIVMTVMDANSINQEKLEEAKKLFMQEQAQKSE